MRKRPERSLKPLDDLKNTVAEPEACNDFFFIEQDRDSSLGM